MKTILIASVTSVVIVITGLVFGILALIDGDMQRGIIIGLVVPITAGFVGVSTIWWRMHHLIQKSAK